MTDSSLEYHKEIIESRTYDETQEASEPPIEDDT